MMVLLSQVQQISSPHSHYLSRVAGFLYRTRESGEPFDDTEMHPWLDQEAKDLVVLSSKLTSDTLAMRLAAVVVPAYHRAFSRRATPVADGQYGQLFHYNDNRLAILGHLFAIVLSSIFPVISIATIFWIHGMVFRLVVIMFSCFLFATAMTFVAQGRRSEVFASTTAYAAIQAAIVGGVNVYQSS
jgi:hypothetical protein